MATATSHKTDPSKYKFNHTMIRIKDPKVTLDFYQKVVGMTLLTKMDFEEAKFTLYFLGFPDGPIGESDAEKRTYAFSNSGILELTHNWGTESDPNFAGYHTGNTDPRGFGHICILVDDLEEACARFEELGVRFIKKPSDGRMKTIAFIADPDGYWIEVIKTGAPN
ncbi:lactoylglutathione lyase [Hyaloraphidium curvatum]|nr:lactoylglutathione lyase [Hyaloraphidium curvatum]